MSFFFAFIDLAKAFDLVNWDGLVLTKIGCQRKLQSMIESVHTDMTGTVQFTGSSSEPFDIHSSVEQGCVVAEMSFGLFFALVLENAFDAATWGIYIWVKSQTTNAWSRSVKADRNVAFVLTNSLQSKLKITITLILGAMNNIFHMRDLPAYPIRWQVIQPRPSPSRDRSTP